MWVITWKCGLHNGRCEKESFEAALREFLKIRASYPCFDVCLTWSV